MGLITLGLLALFWLNIGRAWAQGDSLAATISGVESDTFPWVTVHLSVHTEDGPLTGLTSSDFEIFEADSIVPASSVTVESESLEGLRLVLALDISLPNPNDFAQMKATAQALVKTMGPGDRVAIVSFAEDVILVHDFTNNTQELQTFIDNLEPDLSFTASHQAISEAVNLLAQQSGSLKSVIVITDSRDNTGAAGVDETMERAQAAGVAVYVLGFGNKVNNDPLLSRVSQTGGQYFTLPGAQALESTGLGLVERLRQGYKVTFLSGLKATDTEQPFTVVIAGRGQEVRLQSQFVTQSGAVSVSLPGFNQGQTVAGKLNLSAQVSAPAPEVSVEYILDGELLAETGEPPYAAAFDTATAPPGPHTLVVKAIDSAGNTGQTEASFNIARPIAITLPITPTEVELGEPVVINPQVEVDPNAESVTVEFLFDGQVRQTISSPPYAFTLDSSEYLIGPHTITVRVEDNWGQTAENGRAIQFLPPVVEPAWAKQLRTWLGVDRPTFNRWRAIAGQIFVVTVAVAAIAANLLLALLILRSMAKAHKKASRQKRFVQIANLGNIASRYQLQAEETLGDLNFYFTFRGIELPQVGVASVVSSAGPARYRPQTAPVPPKAPPSVAPPSSAPRPSMSQQTPSQTLKTAKSVGAGAHGCASTLSSILRPLSQLLPGSAGRSVRVLDQQLQTGRSAVQRTTYAPQQMARAAGQLQRQVGKVTPAAAGGQRPVREPRSRTDTDIISTQPPPPPPVSTPHPVVAAAPAPVANGSHSITDFWVETPVIEPGQMLNIDLTIAPLDPYQRQIYNFSLKSRPAEQQNSAPVSQQDSIEVAGISWPRRVLPVMIVILQVIIVTFGIFYLALWRLTGVNLLNWLIAG